MAHKQPLEMAIEIISEKVTQQIRSTSLELSGILSDLMMKKLSGRLSEAEFNAQLTGRARKLPWGEEILLDLMLSTLTMSPEERAKLVEEESRKLINQDNK